MKLSTIIVIDFECYLWYERGNEGLKIGELNPLTRITKGSERQDEKKSCRCHI